MLILSAKTLINKGVFALFFSQLEKIVYKKSGGVLNANSETFICRKIVH